MLFRYLHYGIKIVVSNV